MKQLMINLLLQNKIETSKYNLELVYQAGIKNIIDNIEYYHDKPYSCESVLTELFKRGVLTYIEKK